MHVKFINMLVYCGPMNRKQRGDFVRKVISQVRKKEFPYDPLEKQGTDWSMYDVAQCREIADMIELIRELVDSAVERLEKLKPKPQRGPGRPPTSPRRCGQNIAAAIISGCP